jgi:hypothetical protein
MQPPIPTPLLDDLRPRVLRALHVRGWHHDGDRHKWPTAYQAGSRCTVHAARDGMRVALVLDEGATDVTYHKYGSGGDDALRDLRAEEVLS